MEEGTRRASAERGVTLTRSFLTRMARVRSSRGMSSKLPLAGTESDGAGICSGEGFVSMRADRGCLIALFFQRG